MSAVPSRLDICVVGSVNNDTSLRVTCIPAPGETLLATGKHVSTGGKGANQAIAAAALGSKVALLGCVGDDLAGSAALTSLDAVGANVEGVLVRPGTRTGSAIVMVADDGENVIVVDQGANQHVDTAQVVSQLQRLRPSVVLAQLETNQDAVLAAAIGSGSATFILNPAPMSNDLPLLAEIMQQTDIIVPNRSELARLAGLPQPTTLDEVDRCVAALDFRGCVIVTLGSEGVALYASGAGSRRLDIAPVCIDAVDTSGAGDAFCGALGHSLAAGQPLRDAVWRANGVAAWSTTLHGAQLAAGSVPHCLIREGYDAR